MHRKMDWKEESEEMNVGDAKTVQTVVNDMLELIMASSNPAEPCSEDKANMIDPALIELDDYFANLPPASPDNEDEENEDPIVKCDACKCRESEYWRRVARRLHVCNACFYKKEYLILFSDDMMKKSANMNGESINRTLVTDTKKKKLKQQSQNNNNNGRKQDGSNRPLTRTALNGERSSVKKNGTNSTTTAPPNQIVVKSEPNVQPSSMTSSTTNSISSSLSSASSNSNEAEDMTSIENKQQSVSSSSSAANLRKSARISQSKSKTKSK